MSGILRVQHDQNKPYVVVSKNLTNDRRLSFRLRGILVYLIGKPPGWEARMNELEGAGVESEDAIRTAFIEGRRYGYITTTTSRVKGKVQFEHTIHETPIDPPRPDILNEDGTVYVPPTKRGKPNPDNRTRITEPGFPDSETPVLVSNVQQVSSQQASKPAEQPKKDTDEDAVAFFASLAGPAFVTRFRLHLARWYEDYGERFLTLAWKLAPGVPNTRVPSVAFVWLLNREKTWPKELLKEYSAARGDSAATGFEPRPGDTVLFNGRAVLVLDVDAELRKCSVQTGADETEAVQVPYSAVKAAS